MTKAEEIKICSNCTLAACVGTESLKCPLFQALTAEAQQRLPYFRNQYQRKKQDRHMRRGYWPDIHGALSNNLAQGPSVAGASE